MATRDYLKHFVSTTQPRNATLGDEWYNPTTNLFYKNVALNGTTPTFNPISSSLVIQNSGTVLNSNTSSINFVGFTMTVDSSGAITVNPPTAAAAGANTNVQYNSSNALAGSSNFTWNNSTQTLAVTGFLTTFAMSRSGNINAPSWTTTSPTFNSSAALLTDTTGSGTIAIRAGHSLLSPNFASSSAVTITDAANLYVNGNVASTNTTITNNWAIYNAGNMRVTGTLYVDSAITVTGTLSQSGNYANLGSYNTNPGGAIYPTFGNTNIAVGWNFSGGNAEMNIWNTVNPSTYASTGLRFIQQLTASTFKDLMFLRQDGALAFGGTGNIGTAGQILQSNAAGSPTWVNASSITAGSAALTSTYVGFGSGSNTLTGSANLTWNGTTLAATGAVSATTSVTASGSGTTGGFRLFTNSGLTASNNYMNLFTSQTNGWAFNANGTGADSNLVASVSTAGIGYFASNFYIGTTSQLSSARLSVADATVKTSAATNTTFGTATGGANDFQLVLARSASGTGAYWSLQSVEQSVGYRDIVFQQNGGIVMVGQTAYTNTGVSGSATVASPTFVVGGQAAESMYIRRFGTGIYQQQTNVSGSNTGNLQLNPYGGNVMIGGNGATSTNKFEVQGTAGQLFSVTDSMTGTIFSANDISGIPSIEVLDTGLIKIAQYGGFVAYGISTAQTSAGSTQGTALAITRPITDVTTVAGSTGVLLPTPTIGMRILIRNSGANTLNVYPNSGAQINALGTNTAFSLGTGTLLEFVSFSSTQWYTMNATFAA